MKLFNNKIIINNGINVCHRYIVVHVHIWDRNLTLPFSKICKIQDLNEQNGTNSIPLPVYFSSWVCLEEVHKHVNLVLRKMSCKQVSLYQRLIIKVVFAHYRYPWYM